MKTRYDISDLWWQDRLEMHEDWVHWYYYNADANDGDGQVVEVRIYPQNVMLNTKSEDEFWDHLLETCTTYLHDNGTVDHDYYVELLLKKKDNSKTYRNNTTLDTMNWLIDWAQRRI